MKKFFALFALFVASSQIIFADNLNQQINHFFKSGKTAVHHAHQSFDQTFEGKFPPVVVFNPPTTQDQQAQVTAMSQDQLQTTLATLQDQAKTLSAQANKLHANNEKMIKDNGLIGGIIGAAAGVGLAIGTAGTTPPCTDIAAGAAIGATISIGVIDGPKIKYNSAVLKELRKQILSIRFEILYINARLMSGLTVPEIQALTGEQMNEKTPEVITAMIPSMTPEQITSLPPQYITNLSKEGIQILSADQVRAITPKHIAAMTPDMTPEQNAEIAAMVAQMKEAAAHLPKDPKAVTKIAKSLTGVVKKLATFLPGDLMSTQIAAFTPEQFHAMTKDQIVAISPIQIQVIGGKQFAAIQPDIIPYMTDMQIGLTTPPQWFAITKKQRAKLTPDQISMMAFVQLVMNIAGYFLTPACFNPPK